MYDKKGAANQGRGEGLAPVQLCLLPEFFHPTPSNSLPFAPLYFCVRARARARAFVSLEKVVILSRRKNPVYPAPFLPQSKLSASPHHPPPPSRSSSVPLPPLRSKVLTRFASSPPPTSYVSSTLRSVPHPISPNWIYFANILSAISRGVARGMGDVEGCNAIFRKKIQQSSKK